MIVTSVAFTVSSIGMGGIERVTTTIANGLAQEGYDVTLLNCANKKEYFPVQTQHHVKPSKSSYEIWRLRRKINYLTEGTEGNRTLGEWVKKIFRGGSYDYIILNPDFFIYFNIIKKLHPESKIYLWMHNNYDIYVKEYFSNCLDVVLKSVSSADGIICLESYAKSQWRKWNDHVHVIHNPLTLPPRGCVSDLSSRVIACTSRLMVKQKGLDYLLDVAEGLPDGWRIDLAGDGSDRLWLEEQVEKRGLVGRLRLLGALTDDALERHYSHASMFLSLSRWEGFSLVTVEAMSRGLPVIAFENPALLEVTDGGKYAIMLPVGDVQGVIDAIGELASDTQERQRYGSLSLKRAQAFNLDSVLQDWRHEVLR